MRSRTRGCRRLLLATALVVATGCGPLVASLDLGADEAETFALAVAGGEPRRAYDMLCPPLRFGIPFETFRPAVEANPFLIGATGVSIDTYRSGGGLAMVQSGWIASTSGVAAAAFYLSKLDQAWCLTGVEIGGTPVLPAPGTPAAGAGAARDGAAATTPDRAQLAPALRNDAYRAYGLANPATRRYRMTSGDETAAGTQRADLLEASPTAARFRVLRGGALAALGSLEVSLEPDGIHLIGSAQSGATERTLILPARLDPGSTWQSEHTAGGQTRVHATDVVEGSESVTVPAGTFDAIRVVSNATLESGATRGTVHTVVWYALDVGSVRTESATTIDGTTARVVVELVERGDPGS